MRQVQRYFYAQSTLALCLYLSATIASLSLLASGVNGIMPGLILLALIAGCHSSLSKSLFRPLSRLFKVSKGATVSNAYMVALLGEISAGIIHAISLFTPLFVLNLIASLIVSGLTLHSYSLAAMLFCLLGSLGVYLKLGSIMLTLRKDIASHPNRDIMPFLQLP
jgi:uncharacterized membrane protein YphA (DoxX/SURF4 family)